MAETISTPPAFSLYVWPGQWGLPSFDPICLATVLYLQLTLPGDFSISECNNPDISPSGGWVSTFSEVTFSQLIPFIGQLPFLIHNQITVASFPAIIKYIAGLKTSGQNDLDASLSPSEKSQKVAWISHVESHLGNLVVGKRSYSSRTCAEEDIVSYLLFQFK
jgi:sorting and assembly machinery component 37